MDSGRLRFIFIKDIKGQMYYKMLLRTCAKYFFYVTTFPKQNLKNQMYRKCNTRRVFKKNDFSSLISMNPAGRKTIIGSSVSGPSALSDLPPANSSQEGLQDIV